MRCYLCGSRKRLTDDHIPPKGFFPPPRPSNLITVPCCEACNASYSKDDEAVRAWMSSTIFASPAGEWIFKNKTMGTFRNSPAFLSKFLSTMQPTRLMTVEEGEIDAISFELPFDRIERFALRITKGLLTHYFPDYDYSTAEFRVDYIQPRVDALEKIAPLRDLLAYDQRGDGVFQFRVGLTDSNQSGVWLLVFYGAVLLLVSHTKNGWGKIE